MVLIEDQQSNSDRAREWALDHLGDARHMHIYFLKAMIKSRDHYKSVREMPDEDFYHGLYIALCDHFNEGMDFEDLSDEARSVLRLP